MGVVKIILIFIERINRKYPFFQFELDGWANLMFKDL